MIPAIVISLLLQTPSFDVASIRPNKQVAEIDRDRIDTAPGSVTMRNVSMASCLQWAYNVRSYQVSGPSWLGSERFDISAKTSASNTAEKLRLMMQTLLADRFKLAFHREKKELPIYVLLVEKGGHKLHLATDEEESSLTPNRMRVVAKRMSIPEYADLLSGPLRTPVVDMTGLTQRFDFTMDLEPYFVPDAEGKRPEMADAMRAAFADQLGLKLEQRKNQVEVIVVDHVEKVPTEN